METNEYFVSRRSIRRFKECDVDAQLLKNILSKAMHAPTTGNMQLYSVIVTRDADMRSKLAAAHFSQPASVGARVLLTFCVDFNRFEKWCELRNAKVDYSDFQSFMMGVLDTALFAQQFVTLAELSGLGTCYLGTTTYNAPQIAELLKLPRKVVPLTTVAVGWPAEQPADCGRLPVEAISHDETYCDYSADDIDRLYAVKEARDDSRKFVEENGKDTLAQVFTEVRYVPETLKHFSKVYRDFIESVGIDI